MRSCVPILMLGALLFALMGAWVVALVAPGPTCAAGSSVVACREDAPLPDPDAPVDPLGSSEPGAEDDEDGDGDGNDAAHVPAHALALCPSLAPAGWLAVDPWSYVGFVSEPTTPPPRA